MKTESHLERLQHGLRVSGNILDANDFRILANNLVQKVVGWDFAVWSTVDPATMMLTSCLPLGVDPDPWYEQRVLDLEYSGDDENLFADLAGSGQPARSLYLATDGKPERSRRFCEVLEPMGCKDELRAIFNSGGTNWGALVAYRMGSNEFFTEADSALVARLGHVVAENLRSCFLRTAAEAPYRLKDGPGLILIGDDSQVIDITAEAERWLSLMRDADQWPAAVRAVAAKARATGAREQVRIRAHTGQWIVLHASVTNGDAVAVIIEEARGVELAIIIADLYRLTLQERRVTELVLHGQSTREISHKLSISPYTVQDHLKSIFEKIGVRSRRDLVRELFMRHYPERRRVRSTPGPYGWYLDDERLEVGDEI